jgi:hypothetical protein
MQCFTVKPDGAFSSQWALKGFENIKDKKKVPVAGLLTCVLAGIVKFYRFKRLQNNCFVSKQTLF